MKTSRQELVQKIAEALKNHNVLKVPEWANYVKTGPSKERPPVDDNWWYYRSASVLSTVQKIGPVGVAKLRTRYGGKKRRGHKPPEFRKAGGKIIRKILQDLEKAGLITYVKDKKNKGRIITPKGRSFLDKATKNG